MKLAQSAGMVVTIAMVAGIDMRVDWLVPLAMLGGGVTVFFVSLWGQTRN
ncbi:MAG: hypothetical protein ABL973_10880 [Micropepsaceae bacterium]